MACLTGVGASLVCADASMKFTTSLYKVTAIGGVGRSVAVIDDSHLGLTAGTAKNYCFGDLFDIRPIRVEVQADPDNTTIFPNAATTDGSAPIPLGQVNSTTTTSNFVLTLPTASAASAATTLTFSGAWIDDDGISLTNNDRLRSVYQLQPDGKTFTWTGVAPS